MDFFRLEESVKCILCSKFVWWHLHKSEVRRHTCKERSSWCDDACLVLKKTAVSLLVLLIRETDYTIFTVWAAAQTILQMPVCCFMTGWVSACCVSSCCMAISSKWRPLTTKRIDFMALRPSLHLVLFFKLKCNLKCVLLRLIEIKREIYSFHIDIGFKLSTLGSSF